MTFITILLSWFWSHEEIEDTYTSLSKHVSSYTHAYKHLHYTIWWRKNVKNTSYKRYEKSVYTIKLIYWYLDKFPYQPEVVGLEFLLVDSINTRRVTIL